MTYNSKIHHRRSIRLKDYDYSQSGIYFITICADNKKCLFGKIDDVFDENGRNIDSKFTPADIGKIVEQCWLEIPEHYSDVFLDVYTIMPNHLHGIFMINEIDNIQHNNQQLQMQNKFQKVISGSVGAIVRGFKIGVTKWCRENTDIQTIWHKNYYEHIIRDEKSLEKIRNYIFNNVYGWKKDKLYM